MRLVVLSDSSFERLALRLEQIAPLLREHQTSGDKWELEEEPRG